MWESAQEGQWRGQRQARPADAVSDGPTSITQTDTTAGQPRLHHLVRPAGADSCMSSVVASAIGSSSSVPSRAILPQSGLPRHRGPWGAWRLEWLATLDDAEVLSVLAPLATWSEGVGASLAVPAAQAAALDMTAYRTPTGDEGSDRRGCARERRCGPSCGCWPGTRLRCAMPKQPIDVRREWALGVGDTRLMVFSPT